MRVGCVSMAGFNGCGEHVRGIDMRSERVAVSGFWQHITPRSSAPQTDFGCGWRGFDFVNVLLQALGIFHAEGETDLAFQALELGVFEGLLGGDDAVFGQCFHRPHRPRCPAALPAQSHSLPAAGCQTP